VLPALSELAEDAASVRCLKEHAVEDRSHDRSTNADATRSDAFAAFLCDRYLSGQGCDAAAVGLPELWHIDDQRRGYNRSPAPYSLQTSVDGLHLGIRFDPSLHHRLNLPIRRSSEAIRIVMSACANRSTV